MPRTVGLALPIAVLLVLASVSATFAVGVQIATADGRPQTGVDPSAATPPGNESPTEPVDHCPLGRSPVSSTAEPTPELRDGDDDAVEVACERGPGTTRRSTDTDGDGISDPIEDVPVVGHHPRVVLPDLHRTEKDVVVDVIYAASVADDQRLSDRQLANVRSTWAGFPVDNPGNASGVHLHVREYEIAELEGEFGSEFDADDVDALYERRYGQPPGDGVVNMIVIAEFDVGSSELVAFGSKGGNVAVVRASESRPIVVTHELMHLVLGPIHGERDCDLANDSGHTCRGYLAPDGQAEPFLTELLTRALNRPWSNADASNAANRTVATDTNSDVARVDPHEGVLDRRRPSVRTELTLERGGPERRIRLTVGEEFDRHVPVDREPRSESEVPEPRVVGEGIFDTGVDDQLADAPFDGVVQFERVVESVVPVPVCHEATSLFSYCHSPRPGPQEVLRQGFEP